jgi:aryl-alcohol dehydrogenase-like predicted oxidoreductase
MRLALGTAQIGYSYGISNTSGIVSDDEILNILNIAKKFKINFLDTAISYGESEKRLGNIGINEFSIISKLPKNQGITNRNDIHAWIDSHISESLTRLKIDSLYGILFHSAEDLIDKYGDILFNRIAKFREMGLVNKIGVSIYDFNCLEFLINKYNIDIVQAPFNLIDQRLIKSGWLSRLKEMSIEVHVRSVFLQGLLLMNAIQRPIYFAKWNKLWADFEGIKSDTNKSALELCINFVNSHEEIDKIIIGVESSKQLAQIISIVNAGNKSDMTDQILCNDFQLINPSLWTL